MDYRDIPGTQDSGKVYHASEVTLLLADEGVITTTNKNMTVNSGDSGGPLVCTSPDGKKRQVGVASAKGVLNTTLEGFPNENAERAKFAIPAYGSIWVEQRLRSEERHGGRIHREVWQAFALDAELNQIVKRTHDLKTCADRNPRTTREEHRAIRSTAKNLEKTARLIAKLTGQARHPYGALRIVAEPAIKVADQAISVCPFLGSNNALMSELQAMADLAYRKAKHDTTF